MQRVRTLRPLLQDRNLREVEVEPLLLELADGAVCRSAPFIVLFTVASSFGALLQDGAVLLVRHDLAAQRARRRPASAFFCRLTSGTSRISASQRLICTAWYAAVVVGNASGAFDRMQLRLDPVEAGRVRLGARLQLLEVGEALGRRRLLREQHALASAFRYDVVKSTVRFRCDVIVASWKEMSNFFVPGAKRLFHGEYIHTGVTPELRGDRGSRGRPHSRADGLTVLPRTVPLANPGAGSPNATIRLARLERRRSGCQAEDAAGTATSAATARSGRKRFTGCPPVSLQLGSNESTRGSRQERPALRTLGERGGGSAAGSGRISCSLRSIRKPCSSAAAGDPGVDALHERRGPRSPPGRPKAISVVDPGLVHVAAEEVVEEPVRCGRVTGMTGPIEMFGRPGKMFTHEVRPQEVELPARQLAVEPHPRPGRSRAVGAPLAREAAVGRERVGLGRDVEELRQLRVRDLSSGSTRGSSRETIFQFASSCGLPAGVVARACRHRGRALRSEPASSRVRPPAARGQPVFTNTNGPHVSAATRQRPRPVLSKSGSSSAQGAARSEPSRPWVQGVVGHWIVSRFPEPSTRKPAVLESRR